MDFTILLKPLQEPARLFTGFWIIAGMYVISKLFWMLIYEVKYYRDAGMDYISYGKKYVIHKYYGTDDEEKIKWKMKK